MLVATATRRFLASPLVDLLVGPHGIDRYLELIRPDLALREARAEVTGVRHQTDRSVTLTLRPNQAWRGFSAGQFAAVGVEIGGVRRTRTYSPASSEHGRRGAVELTVTSRPDGVVSNHLRSRIAPGSILHLGPARGEFVLPAARPQKLVLISGGSGVTPVLSMLRTLCDEEHPGEVTFVHYSRTRADALYRAEVEALATAHPNLRCAFVATREGGGRLGADVLAALAGDLDEAHAAVCGPPALIDGVRAIWDGVGGADRVLAETFAPPALAPTGATASGTLRFLRSDHEAAIGAGTLLEQAEAAGLSPEFGCRMGICHTCTCRKSAGTVRNVLSGEISAEEDEDVQLCISVPAGDVALEL
jgi:stearoyl-CoA 9-desaturase NADPH oxidoreductase